LLWSATLPTKLIKSNLVSFYIIFTSLDTSIDMISNSIFFVFWNFV
jgi:hypothetical protein